MPVPTAIKTKIYTKVFVANQGFYQQNNASITLYDETQGLISSDYFKVKNPTTELGDIAQSISKIDSRYFVVVNNSSKIVVLDSNFLKTGEILNLLSPRYILPLSNNKAYVTDLKANKIAIINTATLQITGHINCSGWTEELILIDNFAYVTNYKKSYLYIVNTTTDAITDSIAITKGAEAIVADNSHNIWVLCTSIYNTEKKYLHKINHQTNTLVNTFEFAETQSPLQLKISKDKTKLYFINKNVFVMNTSDSQLPTNYLIDGTGKNYFGLALNPSNNNIYVSEIPPSNGNCKIHIHKNTGEAITTFDAGVFAQYILFDK